MIVKKKIIKKHVYERRDYRFGLGVCNYCKYHKISNEIGQKDLEINSNNFVMFLEEKITNFTIKFNSLENEEVAYGIVDLASDNINYIPLAYNFP